MRSINCCWTSSRRKHPIALPLSHILSRSHETALTEVNQEEKPHPLPLYSRCCALQDFDKLSHRQLLEDSLLDELAVNVSRIAVNVSRIHASVTTVGMAFVADFAVQLGQVQIDLHQARLEAWGWRGFEFLLGVHLSYVHPRTELSPSCGSVFGSGED